MAIFNKEIYIFSNQIVQISFKDILKFSARFCTSHVWPTVNLNFDPT